MTVSLICWALWSCDCQFDVGLCGHVTVSLMLGFVVM